MSKMSNSLWDMSNFTLLWSHLLRSSVWVLESKEVRILWITMLAMKDHRDGVVRGSLVGLADAAKLSVKETTEALEVLMGPDPNDSSGVEDGVRVKRVEGGWLVVNHELYKFSAEAKRMYDAAKQKEHRTKRKKKGKPLAGEEAAVKALEAGNEGEFERLAAVTPGAHD